MDQPPIFKEDRIDVMHDLIKAHSFGTLVGLEDGEISANHLPLILHPEISENGTLRGHISKANPLWKKHDADTNVLIIFQGAHHYISPSWYPSKREHQKVVPTWNYAVVHARGSLKLIEDNDWILAHLNSLTNKHERGYPEPWKVSDAPEKYIAGQIKGIVGVEITIKELTGKWKMSQNKNAADKEGVLRGLKGDGDENASTMLDIMKNDK